MAGQAIDVPPEMRILQMTFDALVTARACYTAAKLGIPDLLKDGSRTSDELAAASDTNPTSLYRLMRCLATIGLVNEERQRRFSLTDLGATLRSDVPGTMRPWVEFCGEAHVVEAMERRRWLEVANARHDFGEHTVLAERAAQNREPHSAEWWTLRAQLQQRPINARRQRHVHLSHLSEQALDGDTECALELVRL